ncbi:MAG: heavy metal translocating P-type ATPase, partial [Aurantimonas coralicida]
MAAAPRGALVRRLARIGAIVCALTGLAVGLLAWGVGRPDIADLAWTAGVIPVLIILVGEIVVSLRQGNFGLDIVAALAMLAALLVGETLAAAVVALMYAGGQALEAFAE